MEYCEMNIWKVNEFNFWKEEVEEFTSKWSQNLINEALGTWSKKPLNLVYYVQMIYSVFHSNMVMKIYIFKYINVRIMFLCMVS